MGNKNAKKKPETAPEEAKTPRIALPDLRGRKILVATPAYEGKVGLPYMNSLFQTQRAVAAAGGELAYAVYANSGSVPRTRNQAVASMLGHGFTDLVFIDADMGWNAEDFCRLCAWDTDIVGAAYPARSEDNPRWIVVWPKEVKRHPSGLLTARRAGTGFLRIRRNVFEKLEELHPELHFQAPHTQSPEEAPHLHAFFKYELQDHPDGGRGHLSEDYFFSDLARDAGFTIWIDPEIYMEHHGNKNFKGRLSDVIQVKDAE